MQGNCPPNCLLVLQVLLLALFVSVTDVSRPECDKWGTNRKFSVAPLDRLFSVKQASTNP